MKTKKESEPESEIRNIGRMSKDHRKFSFRALSSIFDIQKSNGSCCRPSNGNPFRTCSNSVVISRTRYRFQIRIPKFLKKVKRCSKTLNKGDKRISERLKKRSNTHLFGDVSLNIAVLGNVAKARHLFPL